MVLELVRDGRVDAEIAVRLGLPNDEVKRRIAAICEKLGVDGRSALRGDLGPIPAIVAQEPAFVPRFERAATDGGDPLAVVEPGGDAIPAGRPEGREAGRPYAAVFGILVALGIAAVIGWLAIGRGDEPAQPDDLTGGDEPIPLALSAAATFDGLFDASILAPGAAGGGVRSVSVEPVAVFGWKARVHATDVDLLGDTLAGTSGATDPGANPQDVSATLPPGIELLLFRAADEQPAAIQRAFTDDGGNVTVETLFEAPAAGTITSAVADNNGGTLAITVCTGACDASASTAETAVYRSDDAGVTWRIVGTRSGPTAAAVRALAIKDDGVAIRTGSQAPELLGGGTEPACPIEHDAWDNDPGYVYSTLYATGPDGDMALQRPGTNDLYACLGARLVESRLAGDVTFDSYRFGPAAGERSTASWHTGEPATDFYLGWFDRTSTRVLRMPGPSRVAGWVSDTVAIGDVTFDLANPVTTPALIDFATHDLRLLDDPVRAMSPGQAASRGDGVVPPRSLSVLAVRHRTDVVIAPAGGASCASLWASADAYDAGTDSGCLAPGVRVAAASQPSAPGGQSAPVTPAGFVAIEPPAFDPDCRVANCPPGTLLVRASDVRQHD